MRVPAGPTHWPWRTRTRRPRGKSAVDSDVVDAMGGHPVDARSRGDIRADDVPDGINAADHAAGLLSTLSSHIRLGADGDAGPAVDTAAALGEQGLNLAIVILPPPHDPAVLTPLADALTQLR